MVSDSEGDDFEDASEFGVDDSEMFGMGSSTCRKSPMSTYTWIKLSPPNHDSKFLTVTSSNIYCLFSVPESSDNEADALLHFTAEFSSR